MAVIQMSGRELTRLRVLIDLSDDRLTVEAAGRLLGLGRRQVYPLRRAFAVEGPTALVSRKRGSAGNHRHGETFRRTVLSLVHEHYRDFGPTLAVEKLATRHGLRLETNRTAAARYGTSPSDTSGRGRRHACVASELT
jgi:Helix-turn-helix domain